MATKSTYIPRDLRKLLIESSDDKNNRPIIELDKYLDSRTKEIYIRYKDTIDDLLNDTHAKSISVKLVQRFVDWADKHIRHPESILVFKDACFRAIILFKIDNNIIQLNEIT